MKNISKFQEFISKELDGCDEKNIIIANSKVIIHEIIIYLYRKYGDEVTIFLRGKKATIELESPGWFSSVYTLKSLMCERHNRNDGRLVDMKSSSDLYYANIFIKNKNIEWIFLFPRIATDELTLKNHINNCPEKKQRLCVLIDPELSLYKDLPYYPEVNSAVNQYSRGLRLPSYLLK